MSTVENGTILDRLSEVTSDLNDTREAISKLISKPKCTDKLLARPPFRFLFDVIVAVDAASDLGLDRVLTAEEFDSVNLKEKASKLAFLDKVVKHVEIRLGTTVDLNSKKVVAGLDTEKTRAFLQLLALAATTTASSKSEPPTGEVATDSLLGRDDAAVDNDRLEDGKPGAAETSSTDIATLQKPSPLENTIVATRASISALIDKPKCTDKLMSRPPFRFLFDVIIAVDAASDLGLDRVLTIDEFDSSNVKDKASKLSFLAKVVKHVENRLGTDVDLSLKKVVSGLEPEKTCAFLRLLALVATSTTTPGGKATDDDDDSSKGKEDEALVIDTGTDKVAEVSDALNLTAESQFLSIVKDTGSEDEPEDGASDVVGGVANEEPRPDDTVPVDIVLGENKDTIEVVGGIEMGDNEEDPVETAPKGDEPPNTMENDPAADAPIMGDDSEAKIDATTDSGSLAADKDTIWPLRARTGPPVDDVVEVPRADTIVVRSGGVGGALDGMIDVDAAPITLQATIEAVLSVTTPLGQYLDAIDVDAMNQERAYWSNQVALETRTLDEHHLQQNATVLAPLIKRIEDLDAEIVEQEKEIEASLQRIGGDGDEKN
mmetsp:Transcript_29493/g.85837  ORF Transcript_29493/g.85837 Transcript_29493/m.85837 type:complete len:603 (+) Transcript_29493:1009-2817(+)